MAKLGIDLPEDLEDRLQAVLPWGTKAAVVEQLLWELCDRPDYSDEVWRLVQERDARRTGVTK